MFEYGSKPKSYIIHHLTQFHFVVQSENEITTLHTSTKCCIVDLMDKKLLSSEYANSILSRCYPQDASDSVKNMCLFLGYCLFGVDEIHKCEDIDLFNTVIKSVLSFDDCTDLVPKSNVSCIRNRDGVTIEFYKGGYVVKKLNETDFFNFSELYRELFVLEKLRGCDGIVKVFGIVDTGFVMEMAYCDLSDPLTRRLSLQTRVGLCLNIVETMKYIHSRGVAHRDIKPANILLFRNDDCSKFTAKICDFGLSITHNPSQDTTHTGCICTTAYRPPEVVEGTMKGMYYDPQKVDLWSLGCVIFEVLTGTMFIGYDYDNMGMYNILISKRFDNSNLKPDVVSKIQNDDLKDVVVRCLKIDSSQRLL